MYHAQKISNEDMQTLREMKFANRLDLSRSLKFNCSAGSNTAGPKAAANTIRMMNQDSSKFQDLPQPLMSQTAKLFKEEMHVDDAVIEQEDTSSKKNKDSNLKSVNVQ